LHSNVTFLKPVADSRTRLSFSCYRCTHRNTRRTLALSVAGVDAVDLHALTLGGGDKGCEAFEWLNPTFISTQSVASRVNASLPRHADDVVSVHYISRII
jgi:hypothetical protein